VHQDSLTEIVGELAELLPGRFLGKVFQLSDSSMAIDFGLKSDGYLYINVDPGSPRVYLIRRGSRELQKASAHSSGFAQAIRVSLAGGKLLTVTKDPGERIIRLFFTVADELGEPEGRVLIAQLTGRSANLFLVNAEGCITHALRTSKGEGQQAGECYRPPPQSKLGTREEPIKRGNFPTLSAAVDDYYLRLEAKRRFDSLANNLLSKLQKEITSRKKLSTNLRNDLTAHGNPEEHKRLGDLLLANIANAKRDADQVKLKDYYAEGAPTIEVTIDRNISLQEAANESFSRYTKSKRAVEEIGTRLVRIDDDLKMLEAKQAALQNTIATGDESALAAFDDSGPKLGSSRAKTKAAATIPGLRHYRSSDGYEVIVGRTARDNDKLTFRVARPNDLWLHAADYPGSHVIVRNASRKEIPHRTIIEAAQLAAKFSQAGKDSKVKINYTPRKFLTKPKGAAPGLVRVSSVRSITVRPGENIERQ
jgi:predicted ribosome quality control (RQC) complex YloA/Tae2 family protein